MYANGGMANMQSRPGLSDLQQMIAKANFLRKNPTEQKSPTELENLMKQIQALGARQTQIQQQSQSQAEVSFTPDQINVLRAQIHAFRLLSRGVPLPEGLHQAVQLNSTVIPDLEKLLQAPDTSSRIVDSAVKVSKTPDIIPKTEEQADVLPINPADMPKGPFLEDDVNSGIYPYNAYRHPFSQLKRHRELDPAMFATRLQRLLVPTIMPPGLDAQQILNERDRYIEARIQQRMRELESIPSTVGDEKFENDLIEESMPDSESPLTFPATSNGKLSALIELKSLRLIEKQRTMRALVAERLTHGSLVPLNRPEFRRTRKPTIRDARTTEQLERKQRLDRERRAKHKHVEQLAVICNHGRQVIEANRNAQDRLTRLGRSVLNFHAHTEKEEQKRIERISKERLKALKADDEEAYMKLIDTAKDTRITHLLRQTDAFLDSLAQSVVAQQNEGGGLRDLHYETEEGPTSEATFGAQVSTDEPQDKAKVDYYAVAHRISEKITRQPSILVGGTLKEYQLKGLQWMVSLYNNKLNGILADEMGLGKTIQTISLISFLIEAKNQRGPYLVIVPLSTMTNWSGEFAKWAPAIKVISYKGNPAQRRALQGDLRVGGFHVLLTTYEYIIKDRPVLSKMKWLHMIIDEGHRMKNTQSKLAQTLTTYYHSRFRLILTGTPLQNNLPELWALLNFALPKVFNSVKSFDEWFNTPFANSGTGDKIELNEEEALLIIRRLHKVLRPFLLRRLKKDVESELPDKVEKVIKVRMSALQSQLYKQMKKHKMIADGKDSKGKSGGVKGLSNELMQLRKICQHPFLFESVEDKVNPSGVIDERIVRTSGKLELLNRILPKFFATGHRVLIFFQMTKVMDIMADFLRFLNVQFLRLDGGTKTEERASFVTLFNAKESEYKVFILSTRAGGLGLNLQTADTVIIFDSDWNPHADLQAQDRAHRIGQTKAVLILRFITEKSVEEAMYQRARYKLDIDDKVIQAGRFDNKSTQEEQEELLRSILEADQEEENEEAGDMNDEELNALISRSDEEAEVFRKMDIQRERDILERWRNANNRGKPPQPLIQLEELPECYQTDEPFDSKDAEELIEGRGQRKRNVVSYNDGLDDDTWAMALEEGEDLQELTDKTRERKERRATNKLLREAEASNRGTPASDTESRGRRGRKPKPKINIEEPAVGSKRKRGGMKSMSVTPSIADDDDDDERDQKRRKTKTADLSPAIREKMKKAFNECYKAVLACEAEDGRKRCELFREVPDRRDYPDYYQLIKQPIALSQIRKRSQGNFYKDVSQYKADWKLMFNNARTYNQEGSWVYNDAEEMEKVFNAMYDKQINGSGLPGAPSTGSGSGSNASYESALTPMEDDERPPPPTKSRGSGRKQVLSDEEYLTPSDDE
ncbi:SNF2-family ATP dependent chromatin remodeling factor snf21 [Lentinula raphanica]|uniref:SNF2-family ATP dependent chromatin remodeling factor snf21 n=1 Tax=Lentinula raphanica TaxID=153919 RepID=A0AA38P5L0_9AGAR|nr:SNF2-family ATP dependent chromatin remodeling factor snf21 [Lentinula raphanica]KAJ3819642.1 SNF2-family ATP dependent chromatin remodeling factor snf21 [Lentinula raphanica]KAJ3836606.1 SNF2-family ATP dependent chromatin remodeling factor snf21 [Lentinula raphanica]KAJ3973195.1 SNF2-family ATP dependent chromatin remodeling factor snf21 [Lentinula raphanica]